MTPILVFQFYSGTRKEWQETNAVLHEIQLNERQRNKVTEHFLKVTYDYTVSDKNYQGTPDVVLQSEDQWESKREELFKNSCSIKIYYNVDSPDESVFTINGTRPEPSILYVLIPTMVAMAGVGYWLLKVRYHHLFKTEE